MIKHVIGHSYNTVQTNRMPFQHPQGPVPEWPENFHHLRDDGPFMLSREECAVIVVF